MSRQSILFFGVVAVGCLCLSAWLILGEIEESVSGFGEMVPQGKIRVLRAPLGGKVSLLTVRENDTVHKGQVLAELDPEPNAIEKSRYEKQMTLLQEEISALKNGGTTSSNSLANQWMQAARGAYQSKRLSATMQIEKAQHDYQQSIERLDNIETLLQQNEAVLNKYHMLFQEGGLSELEVMDFEQRVISQRGERAALLEEVEVKQATLNQSKQYIKEVDAEFQGTLLNRIVELQKNQVEFQHNAAQTQLTSKRQQIVSPINGVVHQQALRGLGDVVQTGENLLSIVPLNQDQGDPSNPALVAEVKVSNMDLSYIHPDQRATLRLEALPMEKFGKISGTVIGISPAAVKDDRGASYFMVKIRPDKIAFQHAGRTHHLTAGMTVSSDIITRKRTLASFLLEPLQFKIDRALRDPSTR